MTGDLKRCPGCRNASVFHCHMKSGLLWLAVIPKRRQTRRRVVGEHRLVGRIGDDLRRKVELCDSDPSDEVDGRRQKFS